MSNEVCRSNLLRLGLRVVVVARGCRGWDYENNGS